MTLSPWTGVLVACLLSACADGEPRLILEVDFRGRAVSAVNELTVQLTGSRTSPLDGWLVCESVERRIPFASAAELPLTATVEAGDRYRQALAFRVGAQFVRRTGETEVVQVVHPGWASWTSWPAEGERVVRITLDESCFGLACAPGEHCLVSRCETMPMEDVFQSTESTRSEGSCLRSP